MNLEDQVAPHFHSTFNSRAVWQIDSGGRGSTKSSKNALKIAYHMVSDPDCNVVCIRRHKNTLRQSLYSELKRAFRRMGLREGVHYSCRVSPMKITYLGNGNTAYFGGLDDYEKLKGMIADDNGGATAETFLESGDDPGDDLPSEDSIKIVWLSEITEIKDEDDILQTVATFSRGKKDYFCVLCEYNPPRNKFHWVNEWTEEMSERDDTLVTHSSFLTVPSDWLGDIFIQQAEELKKRDVERYNHIYLGMVTGLDGLIYNFDLIEQIDGLDEGETVSYFDVYADTGHQTSATTYLAVGMTNRGRVVLLDTYYYSPNGKSYKKAPSELSEDLWKFLQYQCGRWNTRQDTMIIDSAEGALRNQFAKDYGIRLKPVAKKDKETMIDITQDFFATKGLYVLTSEPNNEIFLTEHLNYEWLEDSVENGNPQPDKSEKRLKKPYYNTHSGSRPTTYGDHTCDGFQYGVLMNMRKYGLKF